MNTIETEQFTWGLSFSTYGIDLGNTGIETLQYGNWLKDARGNEVMRFYPGASGWGRGAGGIGTEPRLSALPKTLHLAYYDYQEDRFYELQAELPQKKLYDLFKQTMVDYDMMVGKIIPRFDSLTIGVAPQGYVMVWASRGDGLNQVELAGPLKATVMQGMTVERYNRETKPAFPLDPDRWAYLSDGTKLKPETVAKLKSGWLPDTAYYEMQRIKYPWRYRLSGNARLDEIEERQGNQEHFYYGPWQMPEYKNLGAMRGVPEGAVFWFTDKAGKRHRVAIDFSGKARVAGEQDISEMFAAFEQVFPKHELWQNDYLPSEDEMATVDIHVSEDFKTYTATLIKGNQSVPLKIYGTQLFDLEPYAHAYLQKSPTPEQRKLLVNGPDAK